MSQQINLFSPVFLRQEKYFSARTMGQAFALILFALVAVYGFARYQNVALEKSAESIRAQLAHEREQLTAMVAKSSTQQSALLVSEVARLVARRDTQREILASLGSGEYGSEAGFSPVFAAFARQTRDGIWLTGITVGPGGNELVVKGRAVHADLMPDYLKGLNTEDVMRGRKVVEMKLVSKEETLTGQALAGGGANTAGASGNGVRRFIEFSVTAPRTIPKLASAADKPAAAGQR